MTRERHLTISTIAPKIELAVKLVHLMPLMTVEHASYTEAMWFDYFCERKLSLGSLFTGQDSLLPFLLGHFFIACLAREYWLVNVAILVTTLPLYILFQTELA